MPRRLNVGCGNEVLPGWVNHDVAPLPGVDVIHDLTQFPWPFESASFEEIRLIHVLEHLPHTIQTLEELHRIAALGATLVIRVPYWNSPDMISDPTHQAFFNEYTFDYFDPSQRHCRERPYYSSARFAIRSKTYWTKAINRYWPIHSPTAQTVLSALARYVGGVIWVIEFELKALER
jgi:hypothetical protein